MNRRDALKTLVIGSFNFPWLVKKVATLSEPSHFDILKGLSSRWWWVRRRAQAQFAAFISGPILQVIGQAPPISELYATQPFKEGGPSIPLDVWDGTDEEYEAYMKERLP